MYGRLSESEHSAEDCWFNRVSYSDARDVDTEETLVRNSSRQALDHLWTYFWTRQLVELSADFHCELFDSLPVFLPVELSIHQSTNVVV